MICYKRDEGTHPSTMAIWSEIKPASLPSYQQDICFRSKHKAFVKWCADTSCCRDKWTRWEKAFTCSEHIPLAYILFSPCVSAVSLSFMHMNRASYSWNWTEEETLVSTTMNDAWQALLGCISGLHYCRSMTHLMLYLILYKSNLLCCLNQNFHVR